MRKTVLIQANKNATSKERDKKWGLSITIGAVSNLLRMFAFEPRFDGVFLCQPFLWVLFRRREIKPH
jgi:hypothetical protein